VAKPKQRPRVNRYSAEFKLSAVKLSQLDGVQVKDVAAALDIHPFMLSKWRKDAREGRIKVPVASVKQVRAMAAGAAREQRLHSKAESAAARSERAMQQLAALKREHALLQREHELLKKAIRFTSAANATSSRSSRRKGTASA
jgi:transposase